MNIEIRQMTRVYRIVLAWLMLAIGVFPQTPKPILLNVDAVALGDDGQQVVKTWGPPIRRKSHVAPHAEDWFYSRGGAVFELDSRDKLVVKCVTGYKLFNERTVLVRQGDSLSKVTQTLSSLGALCVKRYSGPDKKMADGSLKLKDQTVDLYFFDDTVRVISLRATDYVEIR